MGESKQVGGEGLGNNDKTSKKSPKGKSSKAKPAKDTSAKGQPSSDDREVLLNLPAGLKYKLPGKRQRVVIASLVLGLNLLLLIAVVLYFYSPGFQEFVYTVGRD